MPSELAFSFIGKDVETGKRGLIVDGVITTHAGAKEYAKALEIQGYRKISIKAHQYRGDF